MSAPTPRRPVIHQSAEQFDTLRAMLFPWEPVDAERLPMAAVDAEAADQSTNVTFRCSKLTRRELVALADRYGISLSEFCRRLAYATIGAYTDVPLAAKAVREGE